MAVYSPPQVYALARKVGGSPAWALGMVGVVATESGGVTDRVQPNGKGRGLVQIDLGQHPEVTEAQAFDPEWSMRWAYEHTKGDPSKLGAPLFYGPRDHPADAAAAKAVALRANPEAHQDGRPGWMKLADGLGELVDKVVPGSPVQGVKSAADVVADIAHAAVWVASPHNQLRVVEVVMGGALVLFGLWKLAPDTAATVKSVAEKTAMAVAVA